ncbi:MAG: hypothetical protein ACR2F6_08030 [Mycobacteriales bacterium]
MKWLKSFGAFWYDFVIGDDWRLALGVVIALAVTCLVTATSSMAAWWIVPVAVLILLPASLLRAVRR